MTNKFDSGTTVTISGQFTGVGDLKGWIVEYKFDSLAKRWYYVVSTSIRRYYVDENFLTKST